MFVGYMCVHTVDVFACVFSEQSIYYRSLCYRLFKVLPSPQVSFTASDPQLSDKTRFPNFLRAVSSDRATVATVKKLILHYGWKQLGIITDNSQPILTSVSEHRLSILMHTHHEHLT